MNMQQTTKTCRRILARKKIAGVCAGLAERFDLPVWLCLLYTSPSPRDRQKSRMPSSA